MAVFIEKGDQQQSRSASTYATLATTAKDFQTLSQDITRATNQSLPRVNFLKVLLELIAGFSGCQAVELILLKENTPIKLIQNSKEIKTLNCELIRAVAPQAIFAKSQSETDNNCQQCFRQLNNKLYTFDFKADHQLQLDSIEKLEQLQEKVLFANFALSSAENRSLPYMPVVLPHFTKKGSFWIGDIKKFSAEMTKVDKKPFTNIACGAAAEFHSLAIILLLIGEGGSTASNRIGILQLESNKKNFFTKKEIEAYENMGLGYAIVNQKAQAALQERIKELTCLNQLARLADKPKATRDELLGAAVNLLPPAWQFPEITYSRIIYNGKSYFSSQSPSRSNQSKSFTPDSVDKQRTDLIIDGKVVGSIEVFYSEKRPILDEGPFLKEERNLIETISRELALIIERRQNEVEKLALREQLRHADRLATIGQLSAGVAHELNEPLCSILGFTQLALKSIKNLISDQEDKKSSNRIENTDPKLYPSAKRSTKSDLQNRAFQFWNVGRQLEGDLEKILKSSLHAREVIRKLMIFSRQVPAQKISVDLNKIIKEGLYFLESRCSKDGIKLVRDLSSNIPKITADPAQLHQVLVNLIVNACQAMPDGGTINIKTMAASEHLSKPKAVAKEAADYVYLIIEDNGAGMSEEVLRQIFVPFYTTKAIGQGTGLGLSVVHGIISSHGGSIEVRSKPGAGTCFQIALPGGSRSGKVRNTGKGKIVKSGSSLCGI